MNPDISPHVLMKSLCTLARVTDSDALKTNDDELTRRGRRAMLEAHELVDGIYDIKEPVTDPLQAPVATPVEPRVAEDLMERIRND